jgi:hypothetical protein
MKRKSIVIRKRFILTLLALFLTCRELTVAQAPMPQRILRQDHRAPILARLPTAFAPPRAPFSLLSENHEKSVAHFTIAPAGAYEHEFSLQDLSIGNVKTLIFTQSSMPLIEALGGRLRLEAFQSTFHIQNTQLNPFNNCGVQQALLPRQVYARSVCSVDLSGFSLSFRFGRDARAGHQVQGWRRLLRVAGGVLN